MNEEKRPDRFWLVFGLIALGLVVLVAPILVCAGLLLPAVAKARAAAQRQQNQLEEERAQAAEAEAATVPQRQPEPTAPIKPE